MTETLLCDMFIDGFKTEKRNINPKLNNIQERQNSACASRFERDP